MDQGHAGAGSTPVRWNIYGGRKGEITKDVAYDVGILSYVYVHNRLKYVGSKDANTLELYGQLGYAPAYIKYWYAVITLFGIPDSRNSGYLGIGANIGLANDYTVNVHAGYRKVRCSTPASYTDYKLGIANAFSQWKGLTVALAGTNAGRTFYTSPANGKFVDKKALVLSVTKTFQRNGPVVRGESVQQNYFDHH